MTKKEREDLERRQLKAIAWLHGLDAREAAVLEQLLDDVNGEALVHAMAQHPKLLRRVRQLARLKFDELQALPFKAAVVPPPSRN